MFAHEKLHVYSERPLMERTQPSTNLDPCFTMRLWKSIAQGSDGWNGLSKGCDKGCDKDRRIMKMSKLQGLATFG